MAFNTIQVKKYSRFLIFSTLILLLIFILENINGRFWLNDFKVYYSAAKAFFAGKPVYGVPFGEDTGLYKYSPVLLFLFGPGSFLPYSLAAGIHFFLSAFSAIAAIIVIHKIVRGYLIPAAASHDGLILIISFVAVLNHLFRELHLGNVNMVLVFCLSLALWQLLQAKHISAGILIGVAILFKPYFILLGLPLLFHKKLRTIVTAVLTVFGAIVLMMLFSGIDKTISMHRQWISSMADHSVFLASSNTVSSLLENYFSVMLPSLFQVFLLFFIVLLYLSLLVYLHIKRVPVNKRKDDLLILFYFVFLALIPNLLITDTEHFLFSLPLIILCMFLLRIKKNLILSSLFIFFILLYAGNSPEVFGAGLSDKIDKAGVLGIANLGIITCSLFAFFSENKTNTILSDADRDAKEISHP
jgi:hypothetical protein